jgi:integrase
MARQINKLTDRTIRAIKKQGLTSDGNGLYLQVSRSGTKSWLFRFMMDGRSREMGLGSLHTVSLSEARDEAQECKKTLREGIDPIEERKSRLQATKSLNIPMPTFQKCAEDYIRAHSASWKNAKHAKQWGSSLATYAYPVLGLLQVNAVDRSFIMRVLEPIWRNKTETAQRLRARIENILDWARVQGFREGENPALWRGHLDKLLPKPSSVKKVKHLAALPYVQISGFMSELRGREALSALALRLIILTATRSGEARGAKWTEFDLTKAIWTIPAERMKAEKEHIIPLCKEALSIIQSIPRIAGSEYLFTGTRSGKPLSDAVFKKLMERMGVTGITTHGFRSTFRDWAAEQTSFPREVIESALAHQLKDKAEAAYFRSNLLDKRRELMNKWSDYINLPAIKSGDVIKLNSK